MGIDVLGDIFVILSHASDPNNCLCYKQQTHKNRTDSKEDAHLYKIKKLESRVLVHRNPVSSRSDLSVPKSLVGRLEEVVFPDGKRIKSRFQFHEHESIFTQ
ncbi:hypothetical protein MXB_2574 [Myxobolus squamalis]|nr:hypothetical protein MXB_2574 [Myxobolus squamalis]